MRYGYARCSTNETMQDINRQVRDLIQKGINEDNIYYEYESGTKDERKQFNKLFDTVTSGDIIVCTEVSRITRSIKKLLEILEVAKEKQIRLELGSLVIDFSNEVDPMTLATIQLMGVFSELERNLISERVKSGMANAKAKGKQIGRKNVTKEDIPDKFIKFHQLYKEGKITKLMLSEFSKVSYPTCLKYCKMLDNKKR